MFVITGGGTGIGQALALSLAKRGKDVLIVGRREHLLAETAAQANNIQYLCADVASSEGLEHIKSRLNSISHLDGLVNNAGTLHPLMELKNVSVADWQHTMNTNLNAALYLPQALYDKLNNGRVLNIGSGAAYFAIKNWGPYCVSKAALSMLTKCWQLESRAVAFSSAMPGISDTDMQAIARSDENPDHDGVGFYKRLKDQGRLVSAETVGAFLTWLLLDTNKRIYASKEWDIYDTHYHAEWLKPPHQVLHWDF